MEIKSDATRVRLAAVMFLKLFWKSAPPIL